MTSAALKWFAAAPPFDPSNGTTVVEPQGTGPGWWAGAPSALYDEQSGKFFLYYRLRKPRGLGRGATCRIAESTDGVSFRDIWSAGREDFESPSLERASLVRTPDGRWRLFVSLVDPKDNRWRIDVMEADAPDRFRPAQRVKVLTAEDVGAEGVKDPYVVLLGHRYSMPISYAPSPRDVSDDLRAQMHATADVYNTGLTKSHSALALSDDGVRFEWQGDVFAPSEAGWDSYSARLGGLLWVPPVFHVFYDGAADVAGNYEERTGLAISPDLRRYHRITDKAPVLVSPHASGSLRYLDVVQVGTACHYYYEYARPDGSHELRVSSVTCC